MTFDPRGFVLTGSPVPVAMLLSLFLVPLGAAAQAPGAASYFVANIEPSVASKCINCHVNGGRAAYTPLLFSSSASSNHDIFDSYVNNPTLGARADTVLAKIRGAAGHGGGVQVPQGSAEYQKFERYMQLLSETMAAYSVTPSTSAGGSITPATVQTVEEYGTVSFTLAPDEGYELSEVAGTCAGSLNGMVFTTGPIVEDCAVNAVYEEGLAGGLPIWLLYQATQ